MMKKGFWPLMYGGVLVVTLWLATAAIIVRGFDLETREINRNNNQLARSLEEHVRSSLYAADAKLLLMKSEYERAGVTPAVGIAMQSVIPNPLLLQSLILDVQGIVVGSTYQESQGIAYADRSYFQIHRQSDKGQLYISKPMQGKITGKTSIYLSRRLEAPDGSFAGVVALAVDPEYFSSFYRSMELQTGRLVRVVGADGIVRASWNHRMNELGQDISGGALFQALGKNRSGIYQSPGIHYGVDRFFSYRLMADYPLIVQVGYETELALADYRQRRNTFLWIALLGSLLVAFFTILEFRREVAKQKAELALRDSERLNRTILQTTNEGYWVVDARGYVVDVNEAYCRMSGYQRGEFLGLHIQEIDADEPDDQTRARIERIMQNGSECFEVRHRRKDGSVFVVEISATLLPGESPMMVCFCRDITERKQADLALQQSEQRYRALMMQGYDAVVLLDCETLEVVEANPAFEKMTGYKLPLEQPLHVFELFADEKINILRYLAEIHENGILSPNLRKIRTRGGGVREVERTGILINLEGRRYQLTTFRDVTQEKTKQREMHNELLLAAQVQRVLLPEIPRSPQFRIETLFKPSGFVSGDLYYLEWQESCQVLRGFLLDITGHGMATALQTAAVNVLLRELMDLPQTLDLSGQLAWLNRRIPRYVDESTFVAAIGFELDFIQAELRFAAAGISQFLFNAERIEVPGLYLGINEDEEYELRRLPVQAADSICFLTDGITDIFDVEKLWGEMRAENVCQLFNETEMKTKTKDDATAVSITINQFKRGRGPSIGAE